MEGGEWVASAAHDAKGGDDGEGAVSAGRPAADSSRRGAAVSELQAGDAVEGAVSCLIVRNHRTGGHVCLLTLGLEGGWSKIVPLYVQCVIFTNTRVSRHCKIQ